MSSLSKMPGLSRGLTLLFAVAGGIAVGNLYWAQPLLGTISEAFGVSIGMTGLLITLTQVGYAFGIFLIVPLGDILNRRRLVPIMLVLSSLSLGGAAVAPGFVALLISMGAIGLFTVGGQLLPPLAGDLSAPEARGRTIATVASGMLTGVLLSRTISGVLGDILGWRAIFVAAALATLALAALMAVKIPSDPPRPRIGYARLLGSIFTAIRTHRAARVTMVLGAINFGIFTLFWTGMTFLLTAAPFGYSLTQIGLVGLAGLAGAVAARSAGRFHDLGLGVPATGVALCLTLLSLGVAGLASASIITLLAAIVVLDAAVQTVNVQNQTRLLALDAALRSRMNTIFVVSSFVGGAAGSAFAALLWNVTGWGGLMIACGGLTVLALLTLYVNRRELAQPAH